METDERTATTGVTTRLDDDQNVTYVSVYRRRNRSTSTLLYFVSIALAVVIIAVGLYFIFRPDTPTYQAPANTATVTDYQMYWENYPYWLPINEHYTLRQSKEVYNLAYYDGKIVRYSYYSLPIDDTKWTPNRDTVSFTYIVNGTIVTLVHGEVTYVLNTYQPFVFHDVPDRVYIVVPEGALWVMRLSDANFTSEGRAARSVRITLPINPNMNQ